MLPLMVKDPGDKRNFSKEGATMFEYEARPLDILFLSMVRPLFLTSMPSGEVGKLLKQRAWVLGQVDESESPEPSNSSQPGSVKEEPW